MHSLVIITIELEQLNFSIQKHYLQAKPEAICALSKSPHQLVYDFYSLLALTDAKGYVMMQFSWMLLRLYGKGIQLYI